MSEIKSAKAYNHIYERYYGEIDEIHDLNFYDGAVEMSMPELLQILDRYRDTAITAVKIAETEAEQRHAKQLQELRDKAIKLLTKNCDCTAKLFDDNNCEECRVVQSFTQKLNKK